ADHVEGHPVLVAAARVQVLALDVDLALETFRHAVQLDDRRVADRLGDVAQGASHHDAAVLAAPARRGQRGGYPGAEDMHEYGAPNALRQARRSCAGRNASPGSTACSWVRRATARSASSPFSSVTSRKMLLPRRFSIASTVLAASPTWNQRSAGERLT